MNVANMTHTELLEAVLIETDLDYDALQHEDTEVIRVALITWIIDGDECAACS